MTYSPVSPFLDTSSQRPRMPLSHAPPPPASPHPFVLAPCHAPHHAPASTASAASTATATATSANPSGPAAAAFASSAASPPHASASMEDCMEKEANPNDVIAWYMSRSPLEQEAIKARVKEWLEHQTHKDLATLARLNVFPSHGDSTHAQSNNNSSSSTSHSTAADQRTAPDGGAISARSDATSPLTFHTFQDVPLGATAAAAGAGGSAAKTPPAPANMFHAATTIASSSSASSAASASASSSSSLSSPAKSSTRTPLLIPADAVQTVAQAKEWTDGQLKRRMRHALLLSTNISCEQPSPPEKVAMIQLSPGENLTSTEQKRRVTVVTNWFSNTRRRSGFLGLETRAASMGGPGGAGDTRKASNTLFRHLVKICYFLPVEVKAGQVPVTWECLVVYVPPGILLEFQAFLDRVRQKRIESQAMRVASSQLGGTSAPTSTQGSGESLDPMPPSTNHTAAENTDPTATGPTTTAPQQYSGASSTATASINKPDFPPHDVAPALHFLPEEQRPSAAGPMRLSSAGYSPGPGLGHSAVRGNLEDRRDPWLSDPHLKETVPSVTECVQKYVEAIRKTVWDKNWTMRRGMDMAYAEAQARGRVDANEHHPTSKVTSLFQAQGGKLCTERSEQQLIAHAFELFALGLGMTGLEE